MANTPATPIRVLIAEDSPTARAFLVALFNSDPGFEVVGEAADGETAVVLAQQLRPQLISMDVFMPRLNGYQATRRIMHTVPCPVVMVSAGFTQRENELSFEALQAGALSIVPKPGADDLPPRRSQFLAHMRLMAEVSVVRRWGNEGLHPTGTPLASPPANTPIDVIAVAASTGGPGALATLLGTLPNTWPVPMLVAQHITPGFGESLVTWLDGQCHLKIQVAADNIIPERGTVYFAPDGYHLQVQAGPRIQLSNAPPQGGVRPSADRLFHSVGRFYSNRAIGVILTGMGRDGAQGLKTMRQHGAPTIAQDQDSCVVFGMPAAAIALDAAEFVLPLTDIGSKLQQLLVDKH